MEKKEMRNKFESKQMENYEINGRITCICILKFRFRRGAVMEIIVTKICSWYRIINVGTLVSGTRWSANLVLRVLHISTPKSKKQEHMWSGVQCIY